MGGIALPPLVLAVAEAGGLGMLGAVMVPPAILAEMLDGLATHTRGAFGVIRLYRRITYRYTRPRSGPNFRQIRNSLP